MEIRVRGLAMGDWNGLLLVAGGANQIIRQGRMRSS